MYYTRLENDKVGFNQNHYFHEKFKVIELNPPYKRLVKWFCLGLSLSLTTCIWDSGKEQNLYLYHSYPYPIEEARIKKLLAKADSLFIYQRFDAISAYNTILKETEDIDLYQYCVFQIRWVHHVAKHFMDTNIPPPPDFSHSASSFSLLLRSIDSVFYYNKIDDRALMNRLLDENVGEYFWGLGYFALGMNAKYFLEEDEGSLKYFLEASRVLKRTPAGEGILVWTAYEGIQPAKNCREYKLARHFGDLALETAKNNPRDSIMLSLGNVAAGFCLLYYDTQTSKRYFQKALDIVQDSRFSMMEQKVLNLLIRYAAQGGKEDDIAKYMENYQFSIQKIGDQFNVERVLGQMAMKEERWEDAIIHFHKAISFHEKHPLKSKVSISVIYIDLYLSYLQLQQFDLAIQSCLAQNFYAVQDVSDLENLFNIMKDSLVESDNNYIISHEISLILFRKYQALGNSEDLKWSFQFSKLAIEHISNPINTIEESKKIIILNDFAMHFIQHCAKVLYTIYTEAENKEEVLEDYIQLIEKERATILYGDHIDLYRKYNVPIDWVKEEKLCHFHLERLKFRDDYANEELVYWQERLQRMYEMYYKQYPEFLNEKLKKTKITLRDIQDSMSEHEALISYQVIHDTVLVFTMTKHHSHLHARPFSQESLDSLISMQRDPRQINYKPLAFRWYQLLIPEEIRGFSRIMCHPSGDLHHLSFDALITQPSDATAFAIKSYTFLMGFSIYGMQQRERLNYTIYPKPSVSVFAFSDPSTLMHPHKTLKEIPGSWKEAELIRNLFPSHYVYTGNKATKKQFVLSYEKAAINVLHLGLHGKSDKDRKNASWLYFREKNNNFKLDSIFSFEIEAMISQVKLVVIGACESGTGKIIDSEGTYSLARTFLRNGAYAVINSLWNLEDITTLLIFKNFYENQFLPIGESLRQAKLKVLKEFPGRNHPYYWASLVVTF